MISDFTIESPVAFEALRTIRTPTNNSKIPKRTWIVSTDAFCSNRAPTGEPTIEAIATGIAVFLLGGGMYLASTSEAAKAQQKVQMAKAMSQHDTQPAE
jgi:hypothetical protein